MAGELESIVKDMFAALDAGDGERAIQYVAEDVQGVDEVSRRWMRGIDEVGAYVKELAGMASGLSSTMNDVHENDFGNLGIVTFWLEQDYSLDGVAHHVSAPTSVVFRREGGEWKMALFHSIPIEQS
jgi:ketosteroid isomerase-like protein